MIVLEHVEFIGELAEPIHNFLLGTFTTCKVGRLVIHFSFRALFAGPADEMHARNIGRTLGFHPGLHAGMTKTLFRHSFFLLLLFFPPLFLGSTLHVEISP